MERQVLIDRMIRAARKHNRSRADWGRWKQLRKLLRCHRLLAEQGERVEIGGCAPIRWLMIDGEVVYKHDKQDSDYGTN